MPTIYPFRGFRFDESRVGPLSGVVTQPYDKIPDSLREEYLRRSPFNIVRVIKNPDYAAAAQCLDSWLAEGILKRDPRPAFYAYRQSFDFERSRLSRVGLIALVSLKDKDLVVKGHEQVLDKPLADRLNLIRRTRANEGLIFTLFSDSARTMDRLLEEVLSASPAAAEAVDDYGVDNRLWRVDEPGLVSELQAAVRGRPLYIADGHHRFQTSVTFYQECLAAGMKPAGPESFDKRMVALFNMDAEGLRILPTHRGLARLPGLDLEAILRRLERDFEVTAAPVAELPARMSGVEHAFGLLFQRHAHTEGRLLVLRPGRLTDPQFMPGVSGPLRALDVTILHEGVLGPVLGLDQRAIAGEAYVSYFRERQELLDQIRSGSLQLGFLLKPTSLGQVREVSECGLKMPQKSTDFYPKLLTGMVLMKMEMP
jgi:uncharacterized protein (DUF1015 family)